MNLNSITTKITLIFLFAFVLMIVIFVGYLNFETKQKNIQVLSHHESVSKYLMENKMPPPGVIKELETRSFKTVSGVQEVLHNGELIIQKRPFETIYYNHKYYFHVLTPRFRILFEDLTLYEDDYSAYYLFAMFCMLLILIYFWLIKSLKPLSELKVHISKFAQGDLNINCKSSNKDEIGDVANEFDTAVKEIDLLLKSRQLFLRTVMHELKTPIAKGRIVSELVDDEIQKDRLVLIFEKLDFLINDFAKIEKVVSKNYEINKRNFSLEIIVNNALDMLMLDNKNDKVHMDIKSELKFNVDLDLMSMCIKNLIDNAIKYSKNGKVTIIDKNNMLQFISEGEKLDKPLNDYFKPFHNETKSKNHGMGLGLYIVDSILKMHQMNLIYDYKDGHNFFKIQLD